MGYIGSIIFMCCKRTDKNKFFFRFLHGNRQFQFCNDAMAAILIPNTNNSLHYSGEYRNAEVRAAMTHLPP